MSTVICETHFMESSLKFFNKELVYAWFEECKKIDSILAEDIQGNLLKFAQNGNCLPADLLVDFQKKLKEADIFTNYNFANLEAFYGYTVYGFPDDGKINTESNNSDLYYGIAKASTFGVAHTHRLSDAFNYILDGEGVFTGNPADKDRFNFYYHGKPMVKDTSFEIPIGMTHGHLVKEGNSIWFLFVQECGFKPKLRCAGDFHIVDDYNKGQFGPYYV